MIEIKVVRNLILNNIVAHDQPSKMHSSLPMSRQNFPNLKNSKITVISNLVLFKMTFLTTFISITKLYNQIWQNFFFNLSKRNWRQPSWNFDIFSDQILVDFWYAIKYTWYYKKTAEKRFLAIFLGSNHKCARLLRKRELGAIIIMRLPFFNYTVVSL